MSTNPLQRIAALEAENARLKTQTNGNGHLDMEKLLDGLSLRIERSGQLLREDFTGKLAALIAPYIESTVERCARVEQQLTDLEKKFEEHRKAVSGSASEMTDAFIKLRKEAAKDWKAQRAQMQEDLEQIDNFARWFKSELEKHGKESQEAVTSCKLAARACRELAEQMSVPVAETVEHLKEINIQGEAAITRAASNLSKTYHNLRRPVFNLVAILLVSTMLVQCGFGAFILWRNRTLINTNWQELSEHSEQQKEEMKALLDKTLEEAKESQIDREVKVKMWDELIKTLTPQQRVDLINKLRDQVNKAGEKRLGDQMKSSYEQMYGKK